MSIHNGHRSRMKQRFLDHGERVFDDHQLLELLLFYAVPQGDTNPLAHRLMGHFGSLSAVFDASPQALQEVPGVGEHTALLITMLPQLMRRYQIARSHNEGIISCAADAGAYLLPYFFGARNETVFLLSMDAKGMVLGCDCMGEGGLDTVNLNPRAMVETALHHRASQVILAHNHVRGLATPSPEDIQTTLAMRPLFQALNILLADHLIFADEEYISMADSGNLI